MTERVKELLDLAAAEVRPLVGDPAREVLRRAHRDRRRRQLVGGLASVVTVAALVVTAGIVGPGWWSQGDLRPAATPSPSPASAGPARLTVVDGAVRSGGFTLPVPHGWQLVTGDDTGAQPDTTTYCETKPKSLLVNVHAMPGGAAEPCNEWKPVIEVFPWEPATTARETYEHILLPGGQPAWASPRAESGNMAHRTLVVPWSNVTLSVAASPTELSDIVASITTTTPEPAKLVLPDVPTAGRIVVTTDPRDLARPTILENVDEVVGLLAALTDLPAANEPACPRQGELDTAATLTFQGQNAKDAAEVSINVWGDCAEVISSRGGRVRASADLVDELASR